MNNGAYGAQRDSNHLLLDGHYGEENPPPYFPNRKSVVINPQDNKQSQHQAAPIANNIYTSQSQFDKPSTPISPAEKHDAKYKELPPQLQAPNLVAHIQAASRTTTKSVPAKRPLKDNTNNTQPKKPRGRQKQAQHQRIVEPNIPPSREARVAPRPNYVSTSIPNYQREKPPPKHGHAPMNILPKPSVMPNTAMIVSPQQQPKVPVDSTKYTYTVSPVGPQHPVTVPGLSYAVISPAKTKVDPPPDTKSVTIIKPGSQEINQPQAAYIMNQDEQPKNTQEAVIAVSLPSNNQTNSVVNAQNISNLLANPSEQQLVALAHLLQTSPHSSGTEATLSYLELLQQQLNLMLKQQQEQLQMKQQLQQHAEKIIQQRQQQQLEQQHQQLQNQLAQLQQQQHLEQQQQQQQSSPLPPQQQQQQRVEVGNIDHLVPQMKTAISPANNNNNSVIEVGNRASFAVTQPPPVITPGGSPSETVAPRKPYKPGVKKEASSPLYQKPNFAFDTKAQATPKQSPSPSMPNYQPTPTLDSAMALVSLSHSRAEMVRVYDIQNQPSLGVLIKRCSENMQQIYGRTPIPKCVFNEVAKQIY